MSLQKLTFIDLFAGIGFAGVLQHCYGHLLMLSFKIKPNDLFNL